MSTLYIPYQKIPAQLGILPGDAVLLASDITRIAFMAIRNEGNFDAGLFIEAFQKILGPEGTLILPAYNFNLKNKADFDIKQTRPITGALSLEAFGRPDFCRTAHPLHSFLVWGKYSELLCALNNQSSFGSDSPFAFFLEKNVKMIMAGTSVTEAFTFVHFVEESEKVWYRKMRKYNIFYKDLFGSQESRTYYLYAKKAGWTMVLHRLEKLLDERGLLKTKNLNGLSYYELAAQEVYPLIQRNILEDNASDIAAFSWKLLFKDYLKVMAGRLKIYQTASDKIKNDTGL